MGLRKIEVDREWLWILMFRSRKVTVDLECSNVYFIVGWELFAKIINCCRDSSVSVQMKKMSSM